MHVFRQWPLYLIGRILPAAISFGGIAMYTRLLDPGSFGIYALLLSTSYFFSFVGYSWLRVATLRMLGSADTEASDYLATIGISFAGVSLAVGLTLIVFLTIWQPKLPLSLELLTVAAAVASNWFELNVTIVQARIQLVAYGLLQTGRAVGMLVATLLLISAGLKAQALLGGFALGNLAALGASRLWYEARRGRVRRDLLLRMARFGWPSLSGSLSYSVTTVQRYVLQFVAGSAAVGVLAAAGDFAFQTVGLLIGTATLAGQPLAFRAHDLGKDEHLRDQLQNNARLIFAVGLGATVGLIALSPAISHVYFGSRFQNGAATIMALSAAVVFLGGVRGSYFEQVFEIALDTRPLVSLTVLRVVAALAPTWYAIGRFGAVGAVGCVLFAELVAIAASAVWAARVLPVPLPLLSFARIGIAAGAMAFVIELITHRDTVLGLAAAIVAGLVTYGVALALIHTDQLRRLWRAPALQAAPPA